MLFALREKRAPGLCFLGPTVSELSGLLQPVLSAGQWH